MKTNLIDQALNLKAEIDYHDDLFFVKNESEISDSQYDLLKVSLQELLENNPDLIKELEELSGEEKGISLFDSKEDLTLVKHNRPFISLRRTYNFHQYAFYKKLFGDSYIETKLDGIAIELIYHYGKLKHVLTKGNDEKGEEVIHNSKLFKFIPEAIPEAKEVPWFDIRCEAHLTFDDIEDLKDNGIKITKQRNQVSGWVRRKETTREATGRLTLSAYETSPSLTKALNITTGLGMRDWLKKVGFDIPALLTEKELLKQTRNMVCPFDGYLLKANQLSYRDKVDNLNKPPVSSIAFKYNTLFGDTNVIGVIWSVNKEQIVPRLNYAVVNIDGSECSHANLFNAGNVLRLNLRVGSQIRVVMGGDCVPHLHDVLEEGDGEIIKLPTECPCCKGNVSRIGPSLVCNNPEGCTDQLLTTLKQAVSKEGLNIKGLGPNTLKDWIGSGYIKTPLDLFHLESSQIESRHYSAIQNARRITLSKFIYILNMSEFGVTNSIKLSQQCNTLENFIGFLNKTFVLKEPLNKPQELSYLRLTADKKFVRYVERLAMALEVRPDAFIKGLPTVVITGGFEGSRSVMSELLLISGVEVVPRVTKTTTCVLVGSRENDIETASMQTAKRLGVPIILITHDTELNEVIKKVKAL